MKKTTFFFVFTLLLISGMQTHAQFLKKLKNKVNKAVSSVSAPDNKNNTAGANNESSSASAGNTTAIDFVHHNITTKVAYTRSDIAKALGQKSQQDFQYQYSSYKIIDSTIVAKVVIYGYKDGDQTTNSAFVFEDGKLVQSTSVDNIEQQKATLTEAYKRYDWPYDYEKDEADQQKLEIEMNDFKSVLGAEANFTPHGFLESKDRSKFYAMATILDDPLQFLFISSGGKKIKLPSAAAGLMTNIDFSSAAVFGFTKTFEENRKQTDNVLQAAGNSLNRSDIYFIDGHVIKNAVNVSVGGWTWLDPSGRNYLSSGANSGAYLNGKKITDKEVEPGAIWCNAEADKWCYFNNGSSSSDSNPGLYFSDNTYIPNAIHPVQIILNGKNYIVWFSYEYANGDGKLFLCRKEL